MKIAKRSPRTGTINEMEIPVNYVQLDAWMSGALIQNVMPQLTAEQREFLMTGYTPEDWKAIFPPEADDEDRPDFDEDEDDRVRTITNVW